MTAKHMCEFFEAKYLRLIFTTIILMDFTFIIDFIKYFKTNIKFKNFPALLV